MYPIDVLRNAARRWPEATAAIDGEARCDFRSLTARAEALAMGYRAVSGKENPTIVLLGPNSIEMLVALLAVHASGAVVVPLNGRNARAELDAQIAVARPDLVVAHGDYLDRFTPVPGMEVLLTGAPGDPRAMAALEAAHAGQAPAPLTAPLTAMNGLKFTGGSSGVPKAVMQSFRCINTLIASVALAFDLGPQDSFLCAAPMTHGAGALILPILSRGGSIVMTADADPGHLLDLIARHGVTTTWLPPTLLYKLIDEQAAHPRDMSSLRHLVWGGAAAAVARLAEAQAVFGPVVEPAYGQTEAPLILACARAGELTGERLASVGRAGPLAGLAILDPEGNVLGPNQMGEICGRGDLLMTGYLDMPEETAKTIRDGWLHTGDIGMIDADGFLFVKDRIRDVVITGGFNVYPSDVEAVLARHPAISEAVVFGIPDDYWGERLEASVELRAGIPATVEEIAAHCRAALGAVKTPKRIHIVTSLPRSPVGKVLRREAREAALASELPA